MLGTLFKAELNYPEAYKAFKTALRLQPDNAVVQRDLASVQVQLRDYTGHCETRRLLLVGRTGLATNWTGFSVANQLAGNGELALSVMQQYEGTMEKVPENAYERSEVAMYKVRVLEQMGNLAGALAMLESPGFRTGVTDGLAWSEKRAELKLRLGDTAGATKAYAELLRINPENYGYHKGLQAAVLGLPAEAVCVPGAKACEIPSSTMGPGGAATGLADAGQVDLLLALYTALAAAFPRARAVKRIPLDFLPADHPAFEPALAAYLRAGVRKGLPSLYSDVKGLCRLPAEKGQGWEARQASRAAMGAAAHAAASPKMAVLARVAEGLQAAAAAGTGFPVAPTEGYAALVNSTLLPAARKALAAAGLLVAAAAPAGGEGDEGSVETTLGWSFTAATLCAAVAADGDGAATETPAVVPWAALLAARVADEAGRTSEALTLLNAGIAHTPTAIDLYSAKARVLKHCGAFQAAADVADYARTLDFADRYLNVKATQYALRAGRLEVGDKIVGQFVKTDGVGAVEGDPLAPLVSLQVMWYALETAAAHERAGNLGLALKFYTRVEAAIAEWAEDVADFHVYVLRKGPLRAYADTLALMDQIKSHAFYLKAATGAIRCCLGLHVSEAARKGTARCAGADAAALPAAEAGEPADAAAGLSARRAVAAVRAKSSAEAVASVANAVATARNAKFAQQRAGAAGEEGAKDPAAESLHDEDPLGDRAASGAAPLPPKLSACVPNAIPVPAGSTLHLELAHKWARSLTDALPPGAQVARSVKTPTLIAPGVPAERTPLAGCPIARPTVSSTGRTRNWVVSTATAAEAHALAAEVELARGKVAQALAHLNKAAAVVGGLTAAVAPAQLHLTARRVFAAVAAAVADATTPAPLAAAFTKTVAALTSGAAPAEAAGAFMTKVMADAAKTSAAAALTAATVAAEAAGFPALPPVVGGGLAHLPVDGAAGKPGSAAPLVAAAQGLASSKLPVTAADVEHALSLLAAAVDAGAADAGAWAAARAALAEVHPACDAAAPLPAVLATVPAADVALVKASGELTTNHPGGGVPVTPGTIMAKP